MPSAFARVMVVVEGIANVVAQAFNAVLVPEARHLSASHVVVPTVRLVISADVMELDVRSFPQTDSTVNAVLALLVSSITTFVEFVSVRSSKAAVPVRIRGVDVASVSDAAPDLCVGAMGVDASVCETMVVEMVEIA